MRVVPLSLMSWLLMTVTGAANSRFGCGMRVPVTMMSLGCWTASPCAEMVGVGLASTGPVGGAAPGLVAWF